MSIYSLMSSYLNYIIYNYTLCQTIFLFKIKQKQRSVCLIVRWKHFNTLLFPLNTVTTLHSNYLFLLLNRLWVKYISLTAETCVFFYAGMHLVHLSFLPFIWVVSSSHQFSSTMWDENFHSCINNFNFPFRCYETYFHSNLAQLLQISLYILPSSLTLFIVIHFIVIHIDMKELGETKEKILIIQKKKN